MQHLIAGRGGGVAVIIQVSDDGGELGKGFTEGRSLDLGSMNPGSGGVRSEAVQLLVAQFSISFVGGSFYWFGGWEFLYGHGCFANWDKTQEHGRQD